jgi:hypothetical protein
MNTVELAAIIAVTKREVENRIAENGAVKGDQGLQGIQGPQGPKGIQGDRGPQGDTGPQGVAGPQGIDGDTGPRGDDGVAGAQGVAGRDGKDGATPAPAVSVRDVYVDPDDGDLYVELTNSRLINAGHVKGKDGKPGKDGRSGVIVGGGGGSSGGASLPPGGTTGQALAKASNADGDVSWQTFSGGGGSTAWGTITGTLSAQTDLQTALNGKATTAQGALADTALQAADIGVSVQAYSAVLTGTTASYTTADETKLDGIEAGATANSPDATLFARANHTGVQSISTVTGLQAALDGKATTAQGVKADSALQPGAQIPWTDVTGKPTFFSGAYGDLTGIPSTFAPSAHTHVQADITGLVTDLAAKAPIASPTFTGTVTLPAGQVVNGVTLTNAGGTTNFLRADGTYAAPAGGGGGATVGSSVLSFGAAPGTNIATITITGQAAILSGSKIKVWFQAETGTDFNAYEHGLILPQFVSLTAGDIIPATGFTIYAATQLRINGNIICHWEWS